MYNFNIIVFILPRVFQSINCCCRTELHFVCEDDGELCPAVDEFKLEAFRTSLVMLGKSDKSIIESFIMKRLPLIL